MEKVDLLYIIAMLYSSSGSFQMEDSKGLIWFYFEKRVVLSKENYFYSGMTLFAEIGGYLGLLLGVSFLNFASWLGTLLPAKINDALTKFHLK